MPTNGTGDQEAGDTPVVKSALGRRAFLAGAGAGVAGTGIAALTAATTWPSASKAQDDGHGGGGGHADMTADEMDDMHEEGVKLFLENNASIIDPSAEPSFITEGRAMQPLDFEMDGDTKVFELTAAPIEWEAVKGEKFSGMAYNGMVPGPEIRVTEGDKVRIIVHNELEGESTAVHWHGLKLPAKEDGVPFLTQDPIKPGESWTYEFTANNPGSHMYHSHTNSAEQVTKGLLGPFIIEPDKSISTEERASRPGPNPQIIPDPEVDHDHTIIFNDVLGGYTLNGKGFPATDAYVCKVGEKIRFRYMNEGLGIHPMHLHGFPQLVIARDGWNLEHPYLCDTVNIAPGERWDVVVEPDEPGVWAFHCHILTHAEGPEGMFGMVTALIVPDEDGNLDWDKIYKSADK